MKYFFLSLIFILASCSLNKNSSYWNEDQIKNSVDSKRPNKISSKTVNFKIMTFDEFNILDSFLSSAYFFIGSSFQ